MVNEIKASLELFSNSENARNMEGYMRGKFQFLGIKAPVRRECTKEIVKEITKSSIEEIIDITDALWAKDEREYQMVGLDILSRSKKKFKSAHISHLETWIITKSWWDTVDLIASHNIGYVFAQDKYLCERKTQEWLYNSNIWLNRTCLIYQLKYKEETDLQLLFYYIHELKHKKEFFIQKAIGWSLRQASKFFPKEIKDFVENHPLSALAKKEGSKYL